MRKKILSATFVVAMAATIFTGYSAYNSNKERKLTNVALSNVEALASIEGAVGVTSGNYVSFSFNGTDWWGNPNSKYDFFPKYDDCRIDGENRHQVYCIKGDGNCWNGTSCI